MTRETMIRPWYRSRLFWLGLPGLVFLLWAWGISNVTRHEILVMPGTARATQGKIFWYELEVDHEHEADVDLARAQIAIRRLEPEGMFAIRCGFPAKRFTTFSSPLPPGEPRVWFPPRAWRSEVLNADNRYRLLSIPYWLMTGSYAGLWLGALALWQRRKARLSRRAAEPGV